MKKFTLMILSVSVFFTGLGGIAKHIKNYFEVEDQFITLVRTSDEDVRMAENLEKPKQFLIIDRKRNHEFNVKIDSSLSDLPKRSVEFERQPSRVPLPQGIELPRISERDVLIQRNEFEESQNPDEEKTKQIRVFVNKEKKTE